eukprot:EC787658.1.p2 GENE.EC787658.1~~EC787658.1.p2  ORF type:complete len:66 (+),score=13.87 EC787658.1:28-198(+)
MGTSHPVHTTREVTDTVTEATATASAHAFDELGGHAVTDLQKHVVKPTTVPDTLAE